jgi:hypothetical protein
MIALDNMSWEPAMPKLCTLTLPLHPTFRKIKDCGIWSTKTVPQTAETACLANRFKGLLIPFGKHGLVIVLSPNRVPKPEIRWTELYVVFP